MTFPLIWNLIHKVRSVMKLRVEAVARLSQGQLTELTASVAAAIKDVVRAGSGSR